MSAPGARAVPWLCRAQGSVLSFLAHPNRWDFGPNLAMGELLLSVVLFPAGFGLVLSAGWNSSVLPLLFLTVPCSATRLSVPRFCQQTMQMHFSPSFVCGSCWAGGADGRGQFQRGRGRAAPEPCSPQAPLSCCSVLSPPAGHKGSHDLPAALCCLCSAAATTPGWSRPSTMAWPM